MAVFDPHFDLAVIGAGPAALALAWRSAQAGLAVVAVAPEPQQPWDQQFGAWAADIARTEASPAVECTYVRPLVTHDGGQVELDRTYVCLSTPRLQEILHAGCRASGVILLRGRATEIEANARGARVILADGRLVETALVADASGAQSAFVQRMSARPPAFQSAYGMLVEVESHPFEPGEMALMDLRGVAHESPSFLYALPFSAKRVFFEETSLVRRPALPLSVLQRRLESRLARLGLRILRVMRRERCLIPMGTSLPRLDQPVVAFGAAAGMVHPATGYSLGSSFRLAPAAAEAIASGLARSPRRAWRLAQQAIWPPARVRAWELYTFGMEVLRELDGEALAAFLDAFFRLPDGRWEQFMRGTLETRGILSAMAQVFARAEPSLRARLMLAACRSPNLLRATLPRHAS